MVESLKNERMQSIYQMVEMADAFEIVVRECHKRALKNTVIKSIENISKGDILVSNIMAKDNLPPFRASVMDGYAVKYIDQARQTICETKSVAGDKPGTGETNQAVYVTTGAPVPSGYVAVVPIEEIKKEEDGKVILV